ncbi:MAG: aldo/keto reductase [Bdellovibrionales bacterium]|nr:aldo/keto reductase [Bdellovibrionales bacterium]
MIDREKVILGCGNFGGVGSLPSLYGKGESAAEARALLRRAFDIGIRRFDTANSYGGGSSEAILGEWLAEIGPGSASTVEVSTKVGNPFAAREVAAPFGKREIAYQLDRSLRRLRVERIGVYFLHELPPAHGLDETLEALRTALSCGKIRSFGLSNVTRIDVERFLDADSSLANSLSIVQNEFHFLHDADREDLIPFLNSRGIRYSAFGPLAGGLLTGKYALDRPPPTGSRIETRGEPYLRFLNPTAFEKIDRLRKETEREKIPLAQAALRFVLESPGVDSAVIGPRRVEHFSTLGLAELTHRARSDKENAS